MYNVTPSALSTSKAYAISANATGISSRMGGSAAKKPKLDGSLSRMEAADSLTARASFTAPGPDRSVQPGAVRESILVDMPSSVMSSLVDSMDHFGNFHPDGSPLLWR